MPVIPQDVADRAAAIQDNLNRQVSALKSDGDLTVDGRVRHMAKFYIEAKDAMDALQRTFHGTAQVNAESISRRIFGAANSTGADAISVRDADDRASRLETGAEALQLLQRAEENGDTVLARAVAMHAYQQQRGAYVGHDEWIEVVDAYAATRPTVAQAIRDLDQATQDDLRNSMTQMFIFAVHRPSELERYSDHALRNLK